MPATFPDITHQTRTFHREPVFSTMVQTAVSGKEVRLGLYAANRWKWELEISLFDQTTYDTLRNFYIAQSGQLIAFNYTDPTDNTSRLVRFAEDSYDFSSSAFQKWKSVNITLISTDA